MPFARIRPQIGKGTDKLLAELIGQSPQSKIAKTLSRHCGEIFRERYLRTVRPFPKSVDLIQQLWRRGKRLAVASSARREDLEALLTIAGVPELVANSTTGKEVDRSKPDPDIVVAALRKLGTPPDETIMIGDTPYDVESASRAGIRVIALRCGGCSDDDLGGATAIYLDPADLVTHLDSSPLA